MKRHYEFTLDNKLNHYTIYEDGKELKGEEVIHKLNNAGLIKPFEFNWFMGLNDDELIGFCKGNIILCLCSDDYITAKEYMDILIKATKE